MKNYFLILLLALFSASCNRGLSEKDEAMVRLAIGEQEKKVSLSDKGLMYLVGEADRNFRHLRSSYYKEEQLPYMQKIRNVYEHKLFIDNLIKTQKEAWKNQDRTEKEVLIFFHNQYVKELRKMKNMIDPQDSIPINIEEWGWLVEKISGKQIFSSQLTVLYLQELKNNNEYMASRIINRLFERIGDRCCFCFDHYAPYLLEQPDTLFLENDFQSKITHVSKATTFFTQKTNNKVGHKILYDGDYHFTPQFSNPNLTEEWQTHTIEVEASTKYDFAPKIYKTNVRFLLRKKRE